MLSRYVLFSSVLLVTSTRCSMFEVQEDSYGDGGSFRMMSWMLIILTGEFQGLKKPVRLYFQQNLHCTMGKPDCLFACCHLASPRMVKVTKARQPSGDLTEALSLQSWFQSFSGYREPEKA